MIDDERVDLVGDIFKGIGDALKMLVEFARNQEIERIAAIATGELVQLIPDLLEALGGEMVMGLGSAPALAPTPESVLTKAAQPKPAPAAPPKDLHLVADHAPPWDV